MLHLSQHDEITLCNLLDACARMYTQEENHALDLWLGSTRAVVVICSSRLPQKGRAAAVCAPEIIAKNGPQPGMVLRMKKFNHAAYFGRVETAGSYILYIALQQPM